MPTSMPSSGLSLLRSLLVPFVVATLLVLGLPAAASAHTSTAATVSATSAVSSAQKAKAAKAAAAKAAKVKVAKKIQRALKVAKQQKGDPYRYGGTGPSAFDCSGLIYYATRKAGITGVPRTSSAQSSHVRRIHKKWLRAGDLVFFHSGGRVYHVGMYVGRNSGGDRVILHAPGSGKRVKYERIWTNSWFAGTLRRA